MRHKFLFAEETIVTTLVYMILGIAAIPIGIIYSSAPAAEYNGKLTLLVLLGISVPFARFIRPYIERWLWHHLFGSRCLSKALSGCLTLQIPNSNKAITLAASLSYLIFIPIVLDTHNIQGPPEKYTIIGSGSYLKVEF